MIDVEQIAHTLGGAKKAGKGFNCLCPAHPDTRASLSMTAENGKLLVKCHAGCDQLDVLDALRSRGLMNGHDRDTFDFTIAALGKPVHVWTYRDASGARELLKVARYVTPTGKEYRPWLPDGARWKCAAHPVPRPLYGLELLARHPAPPVLVTEGEKACDAARELVGERYVVVAWPGGSNAADKADWSPLRGRHAVLWPDADLAGEKAMRVVCERLAGTASVRIVNPGERAKGWDLADAKAEGWSGDDVLTYIDEHAMPAATPAAKAITSTPLPLIWARDAGRLLDTNYIIKHVIGPGELIVGYGAPKSGKTFFATDLGLSVAAHREWFGHRVQSGLVLYIASEMGARVQRRVRAWLDHHHVGDVPFVIVPRAVNLLDELDVERLVTTLDSLVTAHGRPVLIVVDTLARSMVGGDENSAQDMGRAVAVGDRLRDRFNAATFIVHHAGKDVAKGSRGSSALLGAADVFIRIEAESGEHVATVEWSRDGESGQRYGFLLPIVELGTDPDGDPVRTCVVEPCSAFAAPSKPKVTRRDVALEALSEAISEFGQKMPGTSTIPPGARVVTLDQWKARWTLRTGYDESTGNSVAVNFHKDKAALLAGDRIDISKPYVWINQ